MRYLWPLIFLLSGCAHMTTENPLLPSFTEPIPEHLLVIDIEYLGFIETHYRCSHPLVNNRALETMMLLVGSPALGCSWAYSTMQEDGKYHCPVILPYEWFAKWSGAYDHERLHCLGFAHGGTILEDVDTK